MTAENVVSSPRRRNPAEKRVETAEKHVETAKRPVLPSAITTIVRYCTRYAWLVIGVMLLLAVVSGVYAARHFAITTDIGKLISPQLDWRKRELAFEAAFPGRYESILIVVDAPTQELVAQATAALVGKLTARPELFRSLHAPGGGEFFARSGLLFLPVEQVEQTTRQLGQLSPLIGILASDPTWRGLAQTVSFGLRGAQGGCSSSTIWRMPSIPRPTCWTTSWPDGPPASRGTGC
jgi:uncharacterized protein